MLKKTIRYVDFNGVTRDEDFYFNLSKTELVHMYMDKGGESFFDKVKKIIRAKEATEILRLLEEIVLMSYGEKSEDGRSFIKKNGELAKQFVETPAYEALYFELMSDPDKFGDFINRLVPADLDRQLKQMQAKGEMPKLLEVDTPKEDIIDVTADESAVM